jgi:hypothetical protein
MSETKETMLANNDHRMAESGAIPPASQASPGDSIVEASLARRDQPALQAHIRRYNLTRITQIIWLVTGVLESLIAIRVLLRLMAANPAAGFATFIYNMTAVFLTPFFGLTATPSANGSVLELPSLIAMLVYALLAWGIVRVLWIVFEKPLVQ